MLAAFKCHTCEAKADSAHGRAFVLAAALLVLLPQLLHLSGLNFNKFSFGRGTGWRLVMRWGRWWPTGPSDKAWL